MSSEENDGRDYCDVEHDALQRLLEHPSVWADIARRVGVTPSSPPIAEAMLTKGTGQYWKSFGRIDLIGGLDNRAALLIDELRHEGWTLSRRQSGEKREIQWTKADNPDAKLHEYYTKRIQKLAWDWLWNELAAPNARPRNGALGVEIKSGRVPIGRTLAQIRTYREQQCSGDVANMARDALWVVVAKLEHCDHGLSEMFERQGVKLISLSELDMRMLERMASIATDKHKVTEMNPCVLDVLTSALVHGRVLMLELERIGGVWVVCRGEQPDVLTAYRKLLELSLRGYPYTLEEALDAVPVECRGALERNALVRPELLGPRWKDEVSFPLAILQNRNQKHGEMA